MMHEPTFFSTGASKRGPLVDSPLSPRAKRSRSNSTEPPSIPYLLAVVSTSTVSKDVAGAAAALAHRIQFSTEERDLAVHGGVVQCAVARLAHSHFSPEMAISCLQVLQACVVIPVVHEFLALPEQTHVLRALLASMQARCSPEIRTMSSQLLSKLEPDWWKRCVLLLPPC